MVIRSGEWLCCVRDNYRQDLHSLFEYAIYLTDDDDDDGDDDDENDGDENDGDGDGDDDDDDDG